jgi:hypothetical protein
MRFSSQGKRATLFWADRGVAYVVVSSVGDPRPADPDRAVRLRPDGEDRRLNGFCFDAFSLREPVPTSFENAIGQAACPNSDIENLESSHRRVSLSHRVITRK